MKFYMEGNKMTRGKIGILVTSIAAVLATGPASANDGQGASRAGGNLADQIEQQIEGEVEGRYCVAEFRPGTKNSVLCGSTHPKFGLVVCEGKTCTVGDITGEVVNRLTAPRLVSPGMSEGVRP